MTFRCNLCGAQNQHDAEKMAREGISCGQCESSERLRALAWLMSDELFGVSMMFPDFPEIKAWTGLGMSDVPGFARYLENRFNYTNTYYHKAPLFDVTQPDPALAEKYDFIVSSEVLEHVPHPVSETFQTLYQMLKPNGVLFLTVPYSLEQSVREHFPDLYDYSIAQLKNDWVLVNRTRDGRLQTFDKLVFHGGPGSTLEMRVFSEQTLKQMLVDAGFSSIRIAGQPAPEFGIAHEHPWSLPIAARKGPRTLDSNAATELSRSYWNAARVLGILKSDMEKQNIEFSGFVEWANSKIRVLEQDLVDRSAWARSNEEQAETHAQHIEQLRESLAESEAGLTRLNAEFETRTKWALSLKNENESLTARCKTYESNRWLRLGRRLGMMK